MSRSRLESLQQGEYHVVIDSTLADGSLTYGEVRIPGTTDGGVPAEHLRVPSGARERQPLGSRAALGPGADAVAAGAGLHVSPALGARDAGPLCWLARNRETLDRVQHGLAISCVGDPGPLRYKRSRRGDAEIDRAAAVVLRDRAGSLVSGLEPAGRRRAPVLLAGVRPPRRHLLAHAARAVPRVPLVGRQPRLVTAPSLGESFRAALEIIDAVETNGSYPTARRTGSRGSGSAASTRASPTGRIRRLRCSGC